MALALDTTAHPTDASNLHQEHSSAQGAWTTLVSPTFSTGAGPVLILAFALNDGATFTGISGGGLTWTSRITQGDQTSTFNPGCWSAYSSVGNLSSIAVTATKASAASNGFLWVIVITGVGSTEPLSLGASNSGSSSSSGTVHVSVTPSASGSWLVGAFSQLNDATTLTADSNTSAYDFGVLGNGSDYIGFGRYKVSGSTATTSSGTPVTFGSSVADTFWGAIGIEVLAAPPPTPIGSFLKSNLVGPTPFIKFRTPQAYVPSSFTPDPNPASFRNSQGPALGPAGPNPTGRFRSQSALVPSPFASSQIGLWKNVTPGDVKLGINDLGNNDNYGVLDILVDPVNPNVLWAFICYQGVWKSTDYGMTWKRITNGVQPGVDDGKSWGEAIDPNPNRNPASSPMMIASCGNSPTSAGAGAVVSTDGGVTWTTHQVIDTGTVHNDLYNYDIDPTNSNHIIAGGHSDNHIYESNDGGSTWSDKGSITDGTNSSTNGTYVSFTGLDSKTWIAVAAQSLSANVGGVYQTFNSGSTWTQVLANGGHDHGSEQILVQGRNIYMPVGPGETTPGVYRSTDFGLTWVRLGTTGATCITQTPNYLYAGAGFPTNGTIPPRFQRARTNNDTVWDTTSAFTTSAAATQTNGPKRFATTFDGNNWVIVAGSWLAGIWRYVEPAESFPGATYPSTLPRGPMAGLSGPNPVSRFRSIQAYATSSASTPALAGAVTGAGALTGALSLAEALAGAVTGAGALTGALSLAEALAGAVTGAGALTGALSLAEALAGAVTGAGALTGALSLAEALAGAVTGAGALTGALSLAEALQGALAGQAALTGALSTNTNPALAGAVTGAGALTGALSLAEALQGALAGQAGLTGNLSLAEALQGALAGRAALTGNLSLGEALVANITGTATLAVALSTSIILNGTLAGRGTLTGNLSVSSSGSSSVITCFNPGRAAFNVGMN